MPRTGGSRSRSTHAAHEPGIASTALPVGDVGGFSAAAGLAVFPVRIQIVFAVFAGIFVDIRLAPRVVRNLLRQVGPVPLGFVGRTRRQGGEALLVRWIVPRIETVLVQRLAESVQLRARGLDLGFSDLPEVLGTNVARQKAENHHDDQQLEQGEPARGTARKSRYRDLFVHHGAVETIRNHALAAGNPSTAKRSGPM